MRALFTLRLLAALAGSMASACHHYDASPPSPKPLPAPTPISPSVVQLPVAMALGDLATAMDQAIPQVEDVPRYNGSVGGGADHCSNGFNYGYHIERGAIQLSPTGAGALAAGAHIRYAGAARARPSIPVFGCGPLFGASCGYDGDALRDADIGLTTAPEVRPDWSVSMNAANGSATASPGSRCRVTFLGIDITDRVMGWASDFMNRQLANVNQHIAADTRFHDLAARAWTLAQSPVPIADIGWLSIAPKAVGVSQVTASGDSLRVSMRVVSEPFFQIGNKPSTSTDPLPANVAVPGDDSIRVLLPVTADYAAVEAALRKAFRLDEGGIRYPAVGRFYLKPNSVDVLSNGPDLVVRVGFKGSAKGTLYLAGAPQYDPNTHVVTVPDLDYTTETKNLFVKLANWAGHDALRDDLRAKATIDLTAPIQRLTAQLEAALNQTSGPLTLRGHVDRLALDKLRVIEEGRKVAALLEATGRLSVSVNPAANVSIR